MRIIGVDLKVPSAVEIGACGLIAAFFAASIAFAGWFSGGDVPVKLALITWGAVFAGQVMGQIVDSSGLTLAHYGALKSITIVGGAGLLFGLAVYQAAAWIGF